MAKRYSGRSIVSMVFDDRSDAYKASISIGGKVVARERVGAPRSGGGSVDSPLAYDRAARAALSFAMNDGKVDDSDVAYGAHEVHVGRSAATKYPKRENPGRKGRKPATPSKRKRAARKTSRRPKAKRKANGQFARKGR